MPEPTPQAGMMNAAPGKDASTFQDPTVKEIAQRLDRGVPDQYREDYNRVKAAGLKLMFDPKTNRFIQEGAAAISGHDNDIPILVGMTMQLLDTINKAAKGRMRPEGAAYAIQMLALHGLDFYDRIGVLEVTPDLLGSFMQQLGGAITKFFGLNEQQIADAIRHGRQEIQSGPPSGPAPTMGGPVNG